LVIQRLQSLGVVPLRISAEFASDDLMHIEVGVLGLSGEQLISDAHTRLRTGSRGRQWGLGAINRAAVVLYVSAWEACVEELVRESIQIMRPTRGFHTPNVENTVKLFSVCLAYPDITVNSSWRNCSRQKARQLLNDVLNERHRITHGVNPRLTIHNHYSGCLPGLL
jgi:hypothetical protein